MAWATHPEDTVGTPEDPGFWPDAAEVPARVVAAALSSAKRQVLAFAPALEDPEAPPADYVYVQVLQARDNWAASRRVGEAVSIGDAVYPIRVQPMAAALQSILRPEDPRPSFGEPEA